MSKFSDLREPSKACCRLCPYRKDGWPANHQIPCSLLVRKARTQEPQIYQRDVENIIDEELLRLDGEAACLDCSQIMDESVKTAESGLMYLLEQEIMGPGNTPDWLPPSQHYEQLVIEARSEWGDIAADFEAGTPTWMNESITGTTRQDIIDTSGLSARYLTADSRLQNSIASADSSGLSARYLIPDNRLQNSIASADESGLSASYLMPDNRLQNSIASADTSGLSARYLTAEDRLENSIASARDSLDASRNRPLHNVSGRSPIVTLENMSQRNSPYSQRARSASPHTYRTRQPGEPGRVLLKSPNPLVGPRTRYEQPYRSTMHGREAHDLYAELSKGVRTKSYYNTKPLTTGGDYPSLMMPRRSGNYDSWRSHVGLKNLEFVPGAPHSNLSTAQSQAAEAYLVREAVKHQTARVCQEIIERKHSLDLFERGSPNTTPEEQTLRSAVMKKKSAFLDELKQRKDKMVERLERTQGTPPGINISQTSNPAAEESRLSAAEESRLSAVTGSFLLAASVDESGLAQQLKQANTTANTTLNTTAGDQSLLSSTISSASPNDTNNTTRQSYTDERRVVRQRNSLVLAELLNRVDGIAHPKDQQPGNTTYYSLPGDTTQESSFASIREMHTNMRDTGLGPIAESTAIGEHTYRPHQFIDHRAPRTPDYIHNVGRPGSPIVIEITTNPTIINAPDPGNNIMELNQSMEEVSRAGEENKNRCDELQSRVDQLESLLKSVLGDKKMLEMVERVASAGNKTV